MRGGAISIESCTYSRGKRVEGCASAASTTRRGGFATIVGRVSTVTHPKPSLTGGPAKVWGMDRTP